MKDKWYEDAKNQTLETLPQFIKEIINQKHDYDSIVHGMTAAAIATITAMDREPHGGITGFQASCIMWEFIIHFMHYSGPMALLQYKDMLFPQDDYKFKKTIPKKTFKWLQNEAMKLIEEGRGVQSVIDHWQSIVDGNVPFGYGLED